jgi:hypothetical protein
VSVWRRRGVALLLAILAFAPDARAWGVIGHEKIAGAVPSVLPSDAEPLLGLGPSLVRHAMDADARRGDPRVPDERFRHRFEVDAYSWLDQLRVPARREVWDRRFGRERVQERGLLPWAIADSYRGLVEAFRTRDATAAALAWADLTHYLADASDPLRCTRAASPALAARLDDRLLDRYRTHLELPQVTHGAPALRDPFGEGVKLARESHGLSARVLEVERRAASTEGAGSPAYYARLWHELGPLLEARMGVAAEAAARFGYSAWQSAGRPAIGVPSDER